MIDVGNRLEAWGKSAFKEITKIDEGGPLLDEIRKNNWVVGMVTMTERPETGSLVEVEVAFL